MTGRKKNILTILLAALLLFSMLSISAFAEGASTDTFQIDVNMKDPNSDQVYDTQIYLYKVASAAIDETGNLHMEPVEQYKNLNFDSLTQEEVRNLLDELCKHIEYPGSAAETTDNLTPFLIQKPDATGMIHFTHLETGAYLLMKWEQEEPAKLEMQPTLVYLPGFSPEDSAWEHTVSVIPKFNWQPDATPVPPSIPSDPKLPQTGMVQWPIPILVLAGLFLLVIGYSMTRRGGQD